MHINIMKPAPEAYFYHRHCARVSGVMREIIHYLSLGNQRDFIKGNADLADNGNTYKATQMGSKMF